jgi:hypothetical protein
VRPSARLSAAARPDIYAEMYFWRIVEALAEDFPKLAALRGREAFADLVRDYLARHPSIEPSIRHVGSALPDFLAGAEPAHLADLARLEWARLEVFDAPDAVPLTVESLRRVQASNWPDLRFALVPAFTALVLAWPVHRLWAEPPGPLVAERTVLRVWRQGFAIYQSAMGAQEEAALARLRAGEPFAVICEAFDDPAEAGACLLGWIEDGIVARADGGGDPSTGRPT